MLKASRQAVGDLSLAGPRSCVGVRARPFGDPRRSAPFHEGSDDREVHRVFPAGRLGLGGSGADGRGPKPPEPSDRRDAPGGVGGGLRRLRPRRSDGSCGRRLLRRQHPVVAQPGAQPVGAERGIPARWRLLPEGRGLGRRWGHRPLRHEHPRDRVRRGHRLVVREPVVRRRWRSAELRAALPLPTATATWTWPWPTSTTRPFTCS
jgi:hypothetical protein